MKKLNLGIFCLLSVLLLMVLAACQGGNVDNSAVGNEGTNNNGEGSEKVVELTLWTDWANGDGGRTQSLERLEQFNENHDNIHVELQTTAIEQYKTKLKTQAAGKDLPDMFLVWPGAELQPLVEGDILAPIDSIKDNWSDLIPESSLADYAIDGKQYAIPTIATYTSIIFYDKDKLAYVGYDEFPETYEKFKKMVVALREADITPIQLGNKEQWPMQSSYISTISDRFTGSDFLLNVLDGKAQFVDEHYIESLAVIEELMELNAFNEDMNTIDGQQAQDKFIQGDGALLIEGSWVAGQLIDSLKEDRDVGVALFPSVEGGNGDASKVSGTTGGGIAVNSTLDETKMEAAQEFLKFFYSEELYNELLLTGNLVPANIEVPNDIPTITQELLEATTGGISPVFDAVIPPGVVNTLQNGLQGILMGITTPEGLAEEMQSEMDKELD